MDLYTSALFHGRRTYVERKCERWFVLSAEHGLVAPETVLAPYDVTLKTKSRSERREWSGQVLAALEAQLGDLRRYEFEIHAGNDYRAHGLEAGIRASGARVEVPAAGLGLGEQLALYR